MHFNKLKDKYERKKFNNKICTNQKIYYYYLSHYV